MSTTCFRTADGAFHAIEGSNNGFGCCFGNCTHVWSYEVATPHLFPAGTILHTVSWHDNTANNKHNPDPTAWIGWGSRTMDEMGNGWTDIDLLTDQKYQEELMKRNAPRATTTSQQRQ